MEAKAKKPNSKQKMKETKKSREHADDSIGSHQPAESSYQGLTVLKEVATLHKEHLEQLAIKKNQKKVKDEDAGKAVASAGRHEESVTEAWKAEEAVTVGSSKSAMNQQVISLETEESVRRRVEAIYSRMPPEYREKLIKEEAAWEEAHNAMMANFKKLSERKRSGNSVCDDLENKPTYPSATMSMREYSVQDDLDHDRGKSATQVAKSDVAKAMVSEAESFASHRFLWESQWRKTCGLFTDITVLSSMQFTPYAPGYSSPYSSSCSTPKTLQIFSIKLAKLYSGLEFPLSVYGVVAVRDTVDRNRNLLFSCDRSEAQELTHNDPFLHLIGPSRAIVNVDEVCIEVELKVKGRAGSKDIALFSTAHPYMGEHHTGLSKITLYNIFCKLHLRLQQVKQTVQATILGVQVVKDDGSWPFKYGGLVACCPLSEEMLAPNSGFSRNMPIVLIDSKDRAMLKGARGHVHLWRQVVSVEHQGALDVVIQAYSKYGAATHRTRVRFTPKLCNISQEKCLLHDAEVTITIAWSCVATSKMGRVALENRVESATPLTAAEEEMNFEAERFASYRTFWESKLRKTCGLFTDITNLSSMQFTHYTPGRSPYSSSSCSVPETLQIFSIKLTRIHGGLEFPFSVYGVVAIRDTVECNRNLLFSRDISEAQELKQNDTILHLIGPSRAIVFTDKVCIEIELRVKGAAGSQDKALISSARHYMGCVSTICFKNVFCTLELCLEPVKQTVQATILGVRGDGSWPFKYGGIVACSPLPGKVVVKDGQFSRNIDPSAHRSATQIVLIDSKDEAVLKGEDGYVHLLRQVVSVELQGVLDVVVQAYSKSGVISAGTRARFTPRACNVSQQKCRLDDAKVTITVAWSRVATNKKLVALEACGRKCV
ncbi:uncharacterized protein [Lolium perenne]|uniref:uncharacterized protein n=1 Tax=Lolium perenne TaxID=4522 RepID=UPI0021F62E1E|nr:uncharacterized protein LOC127306205 isoform X2 [Lolium perenne]